MEVRSLILVCGQLHLERYSPSILSQLARIFGGRDFEIPLTCAKLEKRRQYLPSAILNQPLVELVRTGLIGVTQYLHANLSSKRLRKQANPLNLRDDASQFDFLVRLDLGTPKRKMDRAPFDVAPHQFYL